jgi:pentatricopeptide repeat protein
VHQTLLDAGISEDRYVVATMVNAHVRAGDLPGAEQCLRAAAARGLASGSAIAALVDGLIARGEHARCRAVVAEITLLGVRLEGHTASKLKMLPPAAPAGDAPLAESPAEPSAAGGLELTARALTSAFGELAKNKDAEGAVRLVGEMRRSCPNPDTILYNAAILAIGSRGDVEQVPSRPGGGAHTCRAPRRVKPRAAWRARCAGAHVWHGWTLCEVAGWLAQAQALAWEMMAGGFRPDAQTFNALGKAWALAPGVPARPPCMPPRRGGHAPTRSAGRGARAQETAEEQGHAVAGATALLDAAGEEGVAVGTDLYNVVLATCLRHGQPLDALRVYNQVRVCKARAPAARREETSPPGGPRT